MTKDPRDAAAAYRAAHTHIPGQADGTGQAEDSGRAQGTGHAVSAGHTEDVVRTEPRRTDPGRTDSGRTWTAADRAAYVESAIQQAIREGAFDDLPGAGKPLADLGTAHDPDWWIRRKIQTEDLRGLGPAALTLRVEDREFEQRMDALTRESEVREAVEDFNRRVKHARLQLLGGPPVVTGLRDADAEVRAWQERRAQRTVAEPAAPPTPRRWFRRGR